MNRIWRIGAGLALLMVVLPASPAAAATITVTTTADDYNADMATCSLREAIQAANTDASFGGCSMGSLADTIQLGAGPYVLDEANVLLQGDDTNVKGDLDINSDVTILGPPGGVATVDGDNVDRVFHVLGGSVMMTRIHVVDGATPLTVFNLNGGGILVDAGSLTFTDGVVGSGVADGSGGGVAGTAITLQNSTIVSNSADAGGGIAKTSATGSISISDSIIDNNTALGIASGSGGGIVNTVGGAVTLTRTLVRDNKAITSGGGILTQPGSAAPLTIVDSYFDSNDGNYDGTGAGDGGAIWNGFGTAASTLTVTGTAIIGNRAVSGDGIYNGPPGSATISNSTISGNGAAVSGGQGGGLFNAASGTTALSNVTIDANSASFSGGDGGNVYNAGSLQAKNVLMGFALSSGNCGGPAAITQTGPNLEDASFAGGCGFTTSTSLGLGAPADNGGPQIPQNVGAPPTQALQPVSTAIDAGAGCEATDQRGVPRPQGAGCDIGAFEVGICAGMPATKIGVTDGEATVTGTPGNDVILGLGADEVIEGQGGDDLLCGGDGDDVLDGGAGGDLLDGGPGGDQLFGGEGNDELLGREGPDALTDDDGDDTLTGGPQDDMLSSGTGKDLLLGDPGNDVASGGPDNDRLKGGSGKDKLKGDAGKDRLAGQKGKDRCSGGPGKDKANRSCEKTPGVP